VLADSSQLTVACLSDPVLALILSLSLFLLNHVLCLLSASVNHSTLTELKKLNSVALVREQTISTERSPLVGEVSTNFYG
jgi:cytochrome c oxidase assembly factor CtaG